MKIDRLVVGPLAANCYIIRLNSLNVLVDPGADADTIIRYFDLNDLRPDFILNTHGHFDHIGAVPQIVTKYDIPFYIDPDDEEIITDPIKNGSSIFGENNLSLTTYNLIDSGDIEYFMKNGIGIVKTPGHSPGCIVIRIEDHLFTGDLLFRGSIGRTDLPGGNIHDMKDSLLKIKNMENGFLVYPGHGPETELAYEKRNNYYLGNSIFF
jgi:glyoxylase-like metal-dependent hydrolase (beta-lactamase superfamily II)